MNQKITIIDDDKYNQMKLNYETDICKLIENKYNDIVKYYKTVQEEQLTDIEQSAIIMIHDSYPDDHIKEKVYNISVEKGIHLIKFSNGITATHKTIHIHFEKIELKKDRVYSNLEYFLDDYLHNEYNPDFEKLINGQNYAVVKAIIIREQLSKSLLAGYGKKLEYLIPERSEAEKKLQELYYLAYGGGFSEYFNTFLELSEVGYCELMEECQKLLTKIKIQNNG
jgi:hypothetical protein